MDKKNVTLSKTEVRRYDFSCDDDDPTIKIVEADNRYVYLDEDFTYDRLFTETGMQVVGIRMSSINVEYETKEPSANVGFGTIADIEKRRFSPRFVKVKTAQDLDRIYPILRSNFLTWPDKPNRDFKINTLKTRKNGYNFTWKRKNLPSKNGNSITKLILVEVNECTPAELDSDVKDTILNFVSDFIVPRFCEIASEPGEGNISCKGYETRTGNLNVSANSVK